MEAWRARTLDPPANISDAGRQLAYEGASSHREGPRETLTAYDLLEANVRVRQEQARKLAVEVENLSLRFVDRAEVHREAEALVAAFKSHFLSLPRRIADALDNAGLLVDHARIKAERLVADHHHQSLDQLANGLTRAIEKQ